METWFDSRILLRDRFLVELSTFVDYGLDSDALSRSITFGLLTLVLTFLQVFDSRIRFNGDMV